MRKFADRPVEREKLELCLEAARLAPSADNFQPWRFLVFDDPGKRQALADAVFRGAFAASRWAAKAPVLVALLLKESILVNRLGGGVAGAPFQYIDAGIAGEHFALAAAEQGLGTCWIGWFDGRAMLKHLGIKGKGYRSVCLFAVGYPTENQGQSPASDVAIRYSPGFPREPKRKSLSEIAFWNSGPK